MKPCSQENLFFSLTVRLRYCIYVLILSSRNSFRGFLYLKSEFCFCAIWTFARKSNKYFGLAPSKPAFGLYYGCKEGLAAAHAQVGLTVPLLNTPVLPPVTANIRIYTMFSLMLSVKTMTYQRTLLWKPSGDIHLFYY